jgi:chromate reductase, NAD(P)H dehydrogenase (quinone)
MPIKVAAFSGSLRKESFTTKLLKAFQQLSPAGVTTEIVDISKLPLFNEDLEADLPQTVNDLHAAITLADAILLGTPEYNRSYTPSLKNALDWGSRPAGKTKWKGKPVAVVGCSPYSMGAFGAVFHLRQVLVYLDMPVVQQPEFYLANVADKFDVEGKLTDDDTRKRITELWNVFIPWINRVR